MTLVGPVTAPSLTEINPTRTNTAIRQIIERLGQLDDATSSLVQDAIDAATKALAAAQQQNRIVNAGMMVCQDRATGATVDISSDQYALDGVRAVLVSSGTLRCSQQASTTPGGSPNRFRGVVQVSDGTVDAGDVALLMFPVEGIDVADMQFGTANAAAFVFGLAVKLPAGTYALAFQNATSTRSYVVPFTIDAPEADTDQLITVNVPGDTSGTWSQAEGAIGISCRLILVCGSTYQTASTGAWQAGNYLSTSAQSNFMGTGSDTVEVADLRLHKGEDLPTWKCPEFEPTFDKCRRYFEIVPGLSGTGNATALGQGWPVHWKIARKCRTPTISAFYSSSNCAVTTTNIFPDQFTANAVSAGAGVLSWFSTVPITVSARL